ncbi:MAG: hypothetical protein AABX10_00195 [Nanoarchaeota archaeon]
MSRVVDGSGTALDYFCRKIGYNAVADFLEGKMEARRNRDLSWVKNAIGWSIHNIGCGPLVYGGRESYDFFDDFWSVMIEQGKFKVGALKEMALPLQRCAEEITLAEQGRVFKPKDEIPMLFRSMAQYAGEKAEEVTYLEVYGRRKLEKLF